MAKQSDMGTFTPESSNTTTSEDLAARAKREASAAADLVGDAQSAVTDTASSMSSSMMKQAAARGEKLQHDTADGLKAFADAVRDASDKLADRQPGMVTDLIRQAASGLESFSNTLHQKSASEMLDQVRDFGRRHPSAFIAGTVLAGFAIGRFVSTSGSQRRGGMSERQMGSYSGRSGTYAGQTGSYAGSSMRKPGDSATAESTLELREGRTGETELGSTRRSTADTGGAL
jgi:hypothetical protein